MTHYLLRVHDDVEATYAIVELTRKRIAQILARIKLVKKLQASDSEITNVEWWDYGIDVYRGSDLDGSDCALNEPVEHLEDEDLEWLAVRPADVEDQATLSLLALRFDTCRMTVCVTTGTGDPRDKGRVWWTAVIKHCDDEIETVMLTEKMLREINKRPVSRT